MAEDDTLDALDLLLEEERALLRAGRLEALPDLLPRKETALARLASSGAEPTRRAEHLRDKLSRNQALLESAMAGLRDAAAQVTELQKLRDGLATYGSDGRRARLDAVAPRRIEKRA